MSVLKIIVTILMTTFECERWFSTMKRIKKHFKAILCLLKRKRQAEPNSCVVYIEEFGVGLSKNRKMELFYKSEMPDKEFYIFT